MKYTRDLHAYARMVYNTCKPFSDFDGIRRLPADFIDDYLPNEVYWNVLNVEEDGITYGLASTVEEDGIIDSGLASRVEDQGLSAEFKILNETKRKVNQDNPSVCIVDVLLENRVNGEAFLEIYVGPKSDPRTDLTLQDKQVRYKKYYETDNTIKKALIEYLNLLNCHGVKVKPDTGRADFFGLIEQKMPR